MSFAEKGLYRHTLEGAYVLTRHAVICGEAPKARALHFKGVVRYVRYDGRRPNRLDGLAYAEGRRREDR